MTEGRLNMDTCEFKQMSSSEIIFSLIWTGVRIVPEAKVWVKFTLTNYLHETGPMTGLGLVVINVNRVLIFRIF